jgi:hypothetical protein
MDQLTDGFEAAAGIHWWWSHQGQLAEWEQEEQPWVNP